VGRLMIEGTVCMSSRILAGGHSSLLRTAVAALALLALAGCAGKADRNAPPVVRVIATDSGFVIPARIDAGITEVRLINHGQLMHEG
jgi:anti-sigma-K factor RskA